MSLVMAIQSVTKGGDADLSDGQRKIRLLFLRRAVERPPRHDGFRHRTGHRAADRPGDPFPGWSRLKSIQEPDVWAPEDRTGYIQLVLFGAFIAVLGVGANIVVQYLWASLNALSNYF